MDPTPFYVQVADKLERRIKAGEFAPGQRVPGEITIARDYGVARETARRALAKLRDDGLIVTIPARGSYVAKRSGT